MKHTHRIYRLDYGDGYPMGYGDWSLEPSLKAALDNFPESPERDNLEAWEYVQIVPMKSHKRYTIGNDGAQAWRHKETGYTVPDYCRQSGGCPEIWSRTRRKQLHIASNSPVWDYIVECGQH